MSQSPSQNEVQAPERSEPLLTPTAHRRVILAVIALLVVVLLVMVPPYFSISRYQRRVAAAISGALGRPVHFDRISLHLLPIPGLTIENFVVNENAGFGAEPVLRANTVEARLRVGSLWRRRVEVSQISLQAPSINLVHRPDGSWNLQGILMQASQMNSAPTAQSRAGDAPRFPYIEATEARINFKNGIDKLPFSIRDSEFALWLPEPGEWKLRLSGRPVRTDTNVSDVGLLRVEATLGRAVDLSNAPIDLQASWKPTPLGEAGKLTVGYDTGWRGEVSAQASLHGRLGEARLIADVQLASLRRADFVPEHTAEVRTHCEAMAAGLLRSLHDVRCAIPTSNATSLFSAVEILRRLPQPQADTAAGIPARATRPGVFLLQGEVPNVLDWRTISGTASIAEAPASYALAWARLFSRRIPRELNAGGTLSLSATLHGSDAPGLWEGTLQCECVLPAVKQNAPRSGEEGRQPSRDEPATGSRWRINVRHDSTVADASASEVALLAYPQPAAADGRTEAVPMVSAGQVISGRLNRNGYTLLFGSGSVAKQVAAWLPPVGDGMPEETTAALRTDRTWGSAPVWIATPAQSPHRPERRRR